MRSVRTSPILDLVRNGLPLVYLDNGATSQTPRCVMDAIEHYYAARNANVHGGVHYLSRGRHPRF